MICQGETSVYGANIFSLNKLKKAAFRYQYNKPSIVKVYVLKIM